VRVRVKVYGKVEMGVLALGVVAEVDCGLVAAGKVLNLRPVDIPISDETGE
jgi:hypothetical protein